MQIDPRLQNHSDVKSILVHYITGLLSHDMNPEPQTETYDTCNVAAKKTESTHQISPTNQP